MRRPTGAREAPRLAASPPRMRILFVSHTLPLAGQPTSNPGGMQRMAAEMSQALAKHPEVELCQRVLRSSARWSAVRTLPFLARVLWETPQLVRHRRIDVVLFSSMVTAVTALGWGRRNGRAGAILAATPVGRDVTLPNPVYQRVVPRVLRSLDLVMPISRATGEECVSRGLDPNRMAVVPVGIDVSRFPPVTDRTSTRAALETALRAAGEPAVPPGALLLCAVGRHQERKGFHWFVDEVMPRLPHDVVFLLGGSGPMTGAVRAAVLRHRLEERVRILGRVSEDLLELLYRGSDLFMMPNIPVRGDIEGFGVVMLEAGLCGLPGLAADLEGIRDVVVEGENGRLLPPRDAAAFSEAIMSFRLHPGRLTAASRSAARFTASRFGWASVTDQYLAAFRTTLARR